MNGYFLNFFEVNFSDNKTKVFVLPYDEKYQSKEAYNNLANMNPDYWFYRTTNEILVWNYKGNNSNSQIDYAKPKEILLGDIPLSSLK